MDPDDLNRLWNMGEDVFMSLVDEWAESQSLFYRFALLAHTMQLSAAGKLAGMHEGKPSDAVFKAFATVPLKLLAPQRGTPFPAVRDGRTYSTD